MTFNRVLLPRTVEYPPSGHLALEKDRLAKFTTMGFVMVLLEEAQKDRVMPSPAEEQSVLSVLRIFPNLAAKQTSMSCSGGMGTWRSSRVNRLHTEHTL